MAIKSYKELTVWQKSLELSVEIYKLTSNFPKTEIFGLTSQMRRSSVAICSNIAEGQMRGHKNEFIQFLRIAYSSAGELETQLLISSKIGLLESGEYLRLNSILVEVLKMLNKLIKVLID